MRSFDLFAGVILLLVARSVGADAFDPPTFYYSSATGTGAALKQQLNNIIDGHSTFGYGQSRSILQITDADPDNPGHMLLVYDRESLNVAAINPGGSIPGWDNGGLWNREHTWPESRGLGSEAIPDGSDLHNLRPSTTSVNGQRGNLNFGGQYGAQSFGDVFDGGSKWYPGDADAGMVARQMFYMDTRYDGADSGTTDLQLVSGNPGSGGSQLGDIDRMIEWHYAAPPDDFERARNQIIYDDYQGNRNPFVDRPELVWSVFVDQNNDSRITIDGATDDGAGGSTAELDLGRVYVGSNLPEGQTYTLDKSGSDGTYFEVSTNGTATSSLAGRYNAFRTGTSDSRSIDVGLDASTAASGIKSGTVTIDNLDVTTGGGAGRGANDGDDAIEVSLAVLDHPVASFSPGSVLDGHVVDFGIVPIGSGAVDLEAAIVNYAGAGGPNFASALDLDSIESAAGDTAHFELGLAPFVDLAQGEAVEFDTTFEPSGVGEFSAIYTFTLSGEDLPGEQTQTLAFGAVAEAILPGDFNRDGVVNAADYTVWRDSLGETVDPYAGADADGNSLIDAADFALWKSHFGDTAPLGGAGALGGGAVPEPASVLLLAIGGAAAFWQRK